MTTSPAAPASDFLKVMTERGFIHQCSDMPGVDKAAAEGRIIAYVGYDLSLIHISEPTRPY